MNKIIIIILFFLVGIIGFGSQVQASFTWEDNLVAHYKMNDHAATTTVDDSVGSLDGTFVGGNTEDYSVDGITGRALLLDNTYINIGDNDALDFTATTRSATHFVSVQNSVLTAGSAGTWDEFVRERGWIMKDGDTYKAWYSGWKGVYDQYNDLNLVKMGYATSPDGITWTKYNETGGPVYDGWSEDICVVKSDGIYYAYVEDEYDYNYPEDNTRIKLLTSSNGINWTDQGYVLLPGPDGEWDSVFVGTPTVLKEGNNWYMFYEGSGTKDGTYYAGAVGLATSPDGIIWTRDANNPILLNPISNDYWITFNSILKIGDIYYAYADIQGGEYASYVLTSSNHIDWSIARQLTELGSREGGESAVIVDTGDEYLLYTHDGGRDLYYGRTSAFTLSAWVKRDGNQSSFARIFNKYVSTTSGGYQLKFYSTSNTLGCFLKARYDSINKDTGDIDSGWLVPDNVWTHIALTYDGNTVTFYGNDDPVHTETFIDGITANTTALTIGASPVSYSNLGGTGDRTSSITLASNITWHAGYATYSKLVDGDLTTNNLFWDNQTAVGKYIRFDFGVGASKLITEAKFYQSDTTLTALGNGKVLIMVLLGRT